MEFVRHEEGMLAWRAPVGSTNWRQYRSWQLYINQGWRDADLLGQTGASFLFMYEMPSGKTYLHEVGLTDEGAFAPIGKSINRKRLPSKWWMVSDYLAA